MLTYPMVIVKKYQPCKCTEGFENMLCEKYLVYSSKARIVRESGFSPAAALFMQSKGQVLKILSRKI